MKWWTAAVRLFETAAPKEQKKVELRIPASSDWDRRLKALIDAGIRPTEADAIMRGWGTDVKAVDDHIEAMAKGRAAIVSVIKVDCSREMLMATMARYPVPPDREAEYWRMWGLRANAQQVIPGLNEFEPPPQSVCGVRRVTPFQKMAAEIAAERNEMLRRAHEIEMSILEALKAEKYAAEFVAQLRDYRQQCLDQALTLLEKLIELDENERNRFAVAQLQKSGGALFNEFVASLTFKLKQGRIEKGTTNSAAYDLFYTPKPDAAWPLHIGKDIVKVPTGVVTEFSPLLVALIHEKSGYANDFGLQVHGGVIDGDYGDEWFVMVSSKKPMRLNPGKKIAQFIPHLVVPVRIEAIGDAKVTLKQAVRDGGFGSTGTV